MGQGYATDATYGTHGTYVPPDPIGPTVVCGARVELPGAVPACLRVEHEHDCLGHPDEVEKETGPEIDHPAPSVTNLVVTGWGE
jgi:hypothetical protein